MKRHTTETLLLCTLMCTLITMSSLGCREYNESATEKTRQSVQAQQAGFLRAQPIPKFDYSLERDIVIQLYHARNNHVATHTVWRGDTSEIEGHCPSIGYPIPFDTSLTNPLQVVRGGYSSSYWGAAVEQAEPNGIFASKNSTATWVRCVHGTDDVPVYVEGKVTAYPFPVTIVGNKVSPVSGTKASVSIKTRRPKPPAPDVAGVK